MRMGHHNKEPTTSRHVIGQNVLLYNGNPQQSQGRTNYLAVSLQLQLD
jgi:hypothetical protein